MIACPSNLLIDPKKIRKNETKFPTQTIETDSIDYMIGGAPNSWSAVKTHAQCREWYKKNCQFLEGYDDAFIERLIEIDMRNKVLIDLKNARAKK